MSCHDKNLRGNFQERLISRIWTLELRNDKNRAFYGNLVTWTIEPPKFPIPMLGFSSTPPEWHRRNNDVHCLCFYVYINNKLLGIFLFIVSLLCSVLCVSFVCVLCCVTNNPKSISFEYALFGISIEKYELFNLIIHIRKFRFSIWNDRRGRECGVWSKLNNITLWWKNWTFFQISVFLTNWIWCDVRIYIFSTSQKITFQLFYKQNLIHTTGKIYE